MSRFDNDEVDEESQAPGKGRHLTMVLIAFVVVIGVFGGGACWLSKNQSFVHQIASTGSVNGFHDPSNAQPGDADYVKLGGIAAMISAGPFIKPTARQAAMRRKVKAACARQHDTFCHL